MKKKGTRNGGRRGFRLEWEGTKDGNGTLYLFGVDSFGEYEERRKGFLTGAGSVSVIGDNLLIQTFRSGGVEVNGRIRGVTFDPARESKVDDFASD